MPAVTGPATSGPTDSIDRTTQATGRAGGGRLAGLIVLGLAWELWLVPAGPADVGAQVLPWVWPLARPAQAQALHLSLGQPVRLAVCGGRHRRATSGHGLVVWLGSAEVALCLLLFVASAWHVRWRLAQARAARRPPRPTPDHPAEPHVRPAAHLRATVGGAHVLTSGDLSAWERDWRKRWRGKALAVVRPGRTEVAAVVKACARHGATIVPRGGNTGLVGGGVRTTSGTQVLLSMTRMHRVRDRPRQPDP